MKKGEIFKGIINYIFAMVFAVIFGLFLDANVGWFILLTLIMAPFLSVLFAFLSGRMVSVTCDMEEALLSKGDTCQMRVTIQNNSIFPTTPIEVELTNEAGVRSEKRKILVSVLPRSKQTFEVKFQAKICGKSMVGIERIRVTDYLGIFAFGIKGTDYSALQRGVAVIPNIAELSARDDNLMKVMQASQHLDDGEDTVESGSFTFGGFPGYENREYIPGDPLKRINWKQSAKRNRLLVRLDDEMAARAIQVVLDSVFEKNKVDIQSASSLQQYRALEKDEIIPKIAEDAIENALGMMQVLIRHNYAINFFARKNGTFCEYEIMDEIDLEELRLELAHYVFETNENIERLPSGDEKFGERVGIYSTPNSYESVYAFLEGEGAGAGTTIYAVLEEAKKLYNEDGSITLERISTETVKKKSLKEKIVDSAKGCVLPYLLGLLLSIIVYSVFDIPFRSVWTIYQAVVCLAAVIYCECIKEHKVIGTMLTTLLLWLILRTVAPIVFSNTLNYMHWFMSGGESVKNTNMYLFSLLVVFTPFFATVIYYFTRILYRTSFLMLVSLIPFVVYVKVMLDIQVVHVVFVTVLNVAAFLLHYRTRRDKGKPIIGYKSGWISLILYSVIFVLIGLAVPEAETKYYYMFENAFLDGNVSEAIPEEYSDMSEYSGNADGFNELNDRKLYVIQMAEPNQSFYMNRQTFDIYDFENDRWYPLPYYSEPVYSPDEWSGMQSKRSLSALLDAMNCAETYQPGILSQYGIPILVEKNVDLVEENVRNFVVEATNFASAGYITPPQTAYVNVEGEDNTDFSNTNVTRMGIFRRTNGFLNEKVSYVVEYYEESRIRNEFVLSGGANLDLKTSVEMLKELREILLENGEEIHVQTMDTMLQQAEEVMLYQQDCAENTAQIPEAVKQLAFEITKDCVYDWEKAQALQMYFMGNGFVYDLSYDAPDDSVEYFLLEGKTGTCSDFASAYTLMARAVGLTVRYVEGFIPKEEYNGDYVIRTSSGHAYPEVYIPNVGYVVMEATIPSDYNNAGRNGLGIASYFVNVLVRFVLIFTAVSAVIVVMLFLHKIASPYIREMVFMARVRKAKPGRAVVMIYRRIQKKYTKDQIRDAANLTPYEYAWSFEERYGFDISELTLLVEKAAYTMEEAIEADVEKAKELYGKVKDVVKQRKNNHK